MIEINYGFVVLVLGVLILVKQAFFKLEYPEVEQHRAVTVVGVLAIAFGLLIGGLLSVL